MLYRRTEDGGIEVTRDVAADPIPIPLDFAHVSTLRWCDERGELLAGATPTGGKAPSVSDDERGERRLFVCRPGEEWRRISDAPFANDAVATEDRYVASRGAGVIVFDADGTVLHEFKKGRFNWGPPSLSLSRDGSYLAWVRWRGDDKKLCVMRLRDFGATEYSHSLYRYAWLDDRRLVFLLGGPPRVFDAATGEVRTFVPERYRDVAAAGRTLWFATDPGDAVVRSGLDGAAFETAWTEKRSLRDRLRRESRRVDSIVPHEDGSASILLEVYRGRYRIVRREERWLGPLAGRATGWTPLLDCHQPEFGFLLPD